MKVTLKKIGLLHDAAFEVGDLTVICGENNTGKTFATYALYGFLADWRTVATDRPELLVPIEDFAAAEGRIDLGALVAKLGSLIDKLADAYSEKIGERVFASTPAQFAGAGFGLRLGETDQESTDRLATLRGQRYHLAVRRGATNNDVVASIIKARDSLWLEAVRTDPSMSFTVLHQFAVGAVCDLLLKPRLPDVFIASAERTGVTVFRRELNLPRPRPIEVPAGTKAPQASSPEFRAHVAGQMSAYPSPVEANVEFVKNLDIFYRLSGGLAAKHPNILENFADIIGGEFKVTREALYFSPKGSKAKLSMTESSSSVRALLDIAFYLRHIAEPGELLVIDEPELNLHPVNQRKLARLLVALVNAGLRVFITTHSDYLIKEFNTLIMLNAESQGASKVRAKYKYGEHERLDYRRIRLYVTKKASARQPGYTLVAAAIDAVAGVEVETFDKSIAEMNAIQDTLLYGE